MIRILIGGILGGIVIFIAGAVTHMMTPIGTAGLSILPKEEVVLRNMKENIPDSGMYFFPGTDMGKNRTPEEDAAWTAKYVAGPSGVLIFHAHGAQPLGPRLLATEFGTNVLAALLAAFIVSLTTASFGQRVFLVTLLGVIAWVSISLSYWNWYGYPTKFVVAEGIDQLIGFLLCGIVLAVVFRSHRPAA